MHFRFSRFIVYKLIEVLRQRWSYHPAHRDLVGNIQGKFSYRERPAKGIVVKVSGGNENRLSPDNYMGINWSHVHLTKTQTRPGLALEWVREDGRAIQNNRGVFPSPPGIYYIRVQEDTTREGEFAFEVDPLLSKYGEIPTVSGTTATLSETPVKQAALRVMEMPNSYTLVPDVDYTVEVDPYGNPTGVLTLAAPLRNGRYLSVDYRYAGPITGPFPIYREQSNNQAIPGVVLVFGRKLEAGDVCPVVVEANRTMACLTFGGKWNLSFELEVFSTDLEDSREIADETLFFLSVVARSRLATMGVEITEVSFGGESEEQMNEVEDTMTYTSSISGSAEVEWELHYPLDVWLRSVEAVSSNDLLRLSAMSDAELAAFRNNITMLEHMGFRSAEDPFFTLRSEGRTGESIR